MSAMNDAIKVTQRFLTKLKCANFGMFFFSVFIRRSVVSSLPNSAKTFRRGKAALKFDPLSWCDFLFAV